MGVVEQGGGGHPLLVQLSAWSRTDQEFYCIFHWSVSQPMKFELVDIILWFHQRHCNFPQLGNVDH